MLLLYTTRLVLRRFTEADMEPFLVYRNDPDVARYQSWEGCSRAGAETFIRGQQTQEPGVPGQWFRIAIALKEAETLLGDCALHVHSPEARQATIGITLAQPYQGQGFATEALVCLLDYLFRQRHLHRVVADTDPQNIPAWTLLERLGMRREGHLRQGLWFKGQWADEYLYAILCEEWLVKQG
jgi:RimJ/RimL family protein N-acetyltransferase